MRARAMLWNPLEQAEVRVPSLFRCRHCGGLTFGAGARACAQTLSQTCLLEALPPESNLASHVEMRHAWARATVRARNAENELRHVLVQAESMIARARELERQLAGADARPEGMEVAKIASVKTRLNQAVDLMCD